MKKILILKWFFWFLFCGSICSASLFIILSIINFNVISFAIVLFIISFLFAQWWTSLHILMFSSYLFLLKNRILFNIYNILTLNIIGFILFKKIRKNQSNNYLDLNGSFVCDPITKRKLIIQLIFTILNIFLLFFAFAYIWSYKYSKYTLVVKNELIYLSNYNKILFWYI